MKILRMITGSSVDIVDVQLAGKAAVTDTDSDPPPFSDAAEKLSIHRGPRAFIANLYEQHVFHAAADRLHDAVTVHEVRWRNMLRLH